MHIHNHHFMCLSQECNILSQRQRRTRTTTRKRLNNLAQTLPRLHSAWAGSGLWLQSEPHLNPMFWKYLFHSNKRAVILRDTKPAVEPGLLQAPLLWPELVLSSVVCRLCCHPTGQVDLRTATPDWTQRWREPTNTTWMTLYNSSRWDGGLSLCQCLCA